jgi:hypothetical protein
MQTGGLEELIRFHDVTEISRQFCEENRNAHQRIPEHDETAVLQQRRGTRNRWNIKLACG